jgi:plastocyanin
MRTKFVSAGMVCLAIAAAAGCRSSQGNSTLSLNQTGGATVVAKESPTPHFVPNTIEVPRGQKITLTFKNETKVPHNFSISYLDVSVNADPGQSVPVTFTAPDSGKLLFRDTNYMGQGMYGHIDVK